MNTLQNWAQNTIDLITPYAESLNRDFYPLQSSVLSKEKIKVLFLGLNPGGGATYNAQKTNAKWEFVNNKMTAERLLKGNPYFEEGAKSWPLIKGIKRIHFLKEVLESGSFLLANYYYISTPNFKEAQSDECHLKAIAICKQQTLDLVRIVNPELIIVLGTSNGIDQLPFTDKKVILNGYNQRLIVSAEFEGKQVFAIPHPSTMSITTEEADAINRYLTETYNNEATTVFNFIPVDYSRFSIEELNHRLEEHNINLQFTKVKEHEFTAALSYKNDEILLKIVIKDSDKYLGIRDAKAGNKGTTERFYINLTNQNEVVESISEPKLVKINSWLVQKPFKMYGAKSLENFYSMLLKDIFNLWLHSKN